MVHNKRKKNSRQRGSFTHGWGEKKKHRGAGHRGGRGRAGSGKKGDAKKPMYWKDTNYFGKSGFASLNKAKENTINISMLEQQKENFLNTEYASKTGDTIKVNLTALKYTKLLGAGETKTKFDITINTASEKAISKIEAAGGKVNLPTEEQSSTGVPKEALKSSEIPKEASKPKTKEQRSKEEKPAEKPDAKKE